MVKLRRIEILGGGPAGLYTAILLKRSFPSSRVRVYEQNPKGATFGFGVVFSDRALDFLKRDDEEIHDLIKPKMEHWQNMTINHPGGKISLDGVGFAAIGRLELIDILCRQAAAVGVEIRFEKSVSSLASINADLIIGADGLNSMVRHSYPDKFMPSTKVLRNHFAWFGVERPFATLTQTFLNTHHGPVNAHHYRYAPNRSTFIVECDDSTFQAYGFAAMSEKQSAKVCSEIFAEVLDGKQLVTNKSNWRQFPMIWCQNWVAGNTVLVGDAAHTAHFSIGSGTRLALEDGIALVSSLTLSSKLDDALNRYVAKRQPIVKMMIEAANTSAAWYEKFGQKMTLAPLDFGYDYLNRSGRMNNRRLVQIAPRFMAEYEAYQKRMT